MAGVQINIQDDEVNAALDRVARAGINTDPLMDEIAQAMLFSTQRRFETETGPDGRRWQPLSPRTARQRIGKRRRGTENILRVTNRLYSSITGEATSREASVGTNVIYAGIHQEGGVIQMPARRQSIRLREVKGRTRFARKSHKRARDLDVAVGAHTVTIPARPYLGFSDADRAEILQIIEEHFEAAAGGLAE